MVDHLDHVLVAGIQIVLFEEVLQQCALSVVLFCTYVSDPSRGSTLKRPRKRIFIPAQGPDIGDVMQGSSSVSGTIASVCQDPRVSGFLGVPYVVR